MNQKDPYLSELDDLGSDPEGEISSEESVSPEAETVVHGGHEPHESEAATRLDIPVPPVSKAVPVPEENIDDISTTSEQQTGEEASPKDILNLAPNIPVQMVVVMGRKKVTVKDLLDLRSGQVLEMDKLPTEPVDLI